MIFSLLNVRKKTAATLAGIAIGALCLWGVAMWQDISLQELFTLLIYILAMLAAVIGAALLLITVVKLALHLLKRLTSPGGESKADSDSESDQSR